jgi:hypothetical protein
MRVRHASTQADIDLVWSRQHLFGNASYLQFLGTENQEICLSDVSRDTGKNMAQPVAANGQSLWSSGVCRELRNNGCN